VEATTLEQAAESLLSTSDAPEAEGDNLSEAVDEITEPTGEEVEDVAESEDDIEASDEDDYDDQIDDEDLVEVEAEDTMLIPVKVDGKEEQWTLDQLKQSAAGQAAINKRFQEAAEARKQIEQQAAALQQQQQQVLQMYQQAQQGVQEPVAPSRELFDSDPIGYMEEKLKYDEAKAQYDQQMYQVHQMREQQTKQQAQAQQAYLQEQAELLKQHIPEIADPVKGAQLKEDLMQIGMDYGFTAEEMAGVSDSRYVRALNDARKYRALVAKRKQTQAKGQKARPVVKAGAKKTQDGQAATRKKAQSRLQKTGSIDDALSLILNS
jgi:tRNA(Phe) wybutosine-synthesizing methylase Tyw3